jgi:poly(3-hydroxybutyrate) depolymerase
VRTMRWLGAALLCAASIALDQGARAAPLPQLLIDTAQTTVSGISSGGYMAVQLHVAYSATFRKGAGVIAGGPYYCAEGSLVNATGRCMAHGSPIPVTSLVDTTKRWASSGTIDAVANLNASKVYLFSGTQDSAVRQPVMDDLLTYYRSFVPAANIVYKNDLPAEHAMVTEDYGGGCSLKAPPYINDCDYDLAGAMLQQLYGPLNARNNGALSGTFIEFDQTPFVTGHGMASAGWVYVPQACAAGTRCKLHVALHGCKQNSTDVGQQYIRNTGYNRWADSNQIVVLYPQTGAAAINSCWDWWGYDRADYARKSGPQMAAVKAMVDRVSGGSAPPSTLPAPVGVAASGATSNSMVIVWGAVNGAAGYNVYRGDANVNGTPVVATSYTDTGLAPGTTYSWTVTAVDAMGGESAPSAPATGTTTGTAASCYTSSNYAHVSAGRAHMSWGFTYANGSNQSMGLWNVFVTTTLKQTGPNHYVIGTCP